MSVGGEGGRPPWLVFEGGAWVDLRLVNARLRAVLVVAGMVLVLTLSAWLTQSLGAEGAFTKAVLSTLVACAALAFMTAALASASHGSIAIGAYTFAFAVMPLVGLFMTAVVIQHAVRTIRSRGVPVGWFGADDSAFAQLRHRVCTACGYSLEGLASPICPECGALTATGEPAPS